MHSTPSTLHPQVIYAIVFSAGLNLLSNIIFKSSVPTIILFSVFCKDIDDLYKWLTFQPKAFKPDLFADNKITIIHDISRVYINLIESICSVINYEWGFVH